jgi:O-glycosyl hydrolase
VTSSSANLAGGTAVAVAGGSFSASLGATSVTTFVCK